VRRLRRVSKDANTRPGPTYETPRKRAAPQDEGSMRGLSFFQRYPAISSPALAYTTPPSIAIALPTT